MYNRSMEDSGNERQSLRHTDKKSDERADTQLHRHADMNIDRQNDSSQAITIFIPTLQSIPIPTGPRDISLKYALTLSAESIGCVLFYLLQLGQEVY